MTVFHKLQLCSAAELCLYTSCLCADVIARTHDMLKWFIEKLISCGQLEVPLSVSQK